MGRGWEVRLALLTITLSVWIGFQIGLDRPWPASVFLFVIPAIVVFFAIRSSKRSRHAINLPSQQMAGLPNQIEQLSARLGQVARKLDDVVNLLTTQTALPGVGAKKDDRQ
jgi:hypothetical protein